MAQKLFGTDGIRGEANTWPISAEGATRVGRALAKLLKSSTPNSLDEIHVLVGKDTRVSGTMLEQSLSAGLLAEGIHVHFLGVAPTPAVAYLTANNEFSAGIMITASHNPYQDNGIKIFGSDGYKLNEAQEELIEADILLERDVTIPTTAKPLNIGSFSQDSQLLKDYSSFAKSTLSENNQSENNQSKNNLSGIKLVVDTANGAASAIAQSIFEDLGAEVIALNTTPNGTNINADCGALYPEATAKVVLREKATLGACFDGDTDRVIFIDEKGTVVSGDSVLALCAIALKKQNQLKDDTLVATVMSNLGMRDCLEPHGIKIIATAVGDKHVVQTMRDGNYSFGGENSGHLIFAKNATTGDGIMSTLMLLSILNTEKQTLSELASCLTPYPCELSAIQVREKPPLDSVPEIKQAIQTTENDLAQLGRVLVRYSGTEKKIRVLVEAKDADKAKLYSELICSAINATIAL